jgi:hypothetical protein
MPRQSSLSFGGQVAGRCSIGGSVFFYEKLGQGNNIAWTLPQGWEPQVYDIQAVKQVFAEGTFFDCNDQIAV